MSAKPPLSVIFHSLAGSWRLKRSIKSVLPGFPSGIFEGTATFTPRKPSAHSVTAELLYAEQGELRTDNGFVLKANRKYVYRYTAEEDKISAWFVKEETKQLDGKEEVDNLFHDLEISGGSSGDDAASNGGSAAVVAETPSVWAGRGEHLCSLDMYWAYYEFRLVPSSDGADGADQMNVFGVRYKVQGPEKDYTSDTAYERTFSSAMALR